jgi:hypothetical protein
VIIDSDGRALRNVGMTEDNDLIDSIVMDKIIDINMMTNETRHRFARFREPDRQFGRRP